MIRTRKYVDRAGNVAWHLTTGNHKHVLRFTAKQYVENRESIVGFPDFPVDGALCRATND